MNPYPEDVLRFLSETLSQDIAPTVTPAYRSATLVFISMLLSAASDEWDRAASRLRDENRSLCRLFGEIQQLPVGDALRDRLAEHQSSDDDDIRVSALRTTNEQLRATLTEVHAIVESLDTEEAKSADTQIWRELRESTERRRLTIDMF